MAALSRQATPISSLRQSLFQLHCGFNTTAEQRAAYNRVALVLSGQQDNAVDVQASKVLTSQ